MKGIQSDVCQEGNSQGLIIKVCFEHRGGEVIARRRRIGFMEEAACEPSHG